MELKNCSWCNQHKAISEFYTRKGKPWGWCKECHREWSRLEYVRNARNRKNRTRGFQQRQLVKSYLLEHPCIDCGESNPICLEFDHIRGTKKFNISHGVSTQSWDAVQEEINKCEVVCANCHRIRTAGRRNV